MNRSYEAGGLTAEEVITAIVGAVVFSKPPRDASRQLALARARVDTRLAELALEPLLEHLEERPHDAAALFALVLLGSAHPEAAETARISPQQEAARLAELLESEGSIEWAESLRGIFEVESGSGRGDKRARRCADGDRDGPRAKVERPRKRRVPRALVLLGLGVVLIGSGIMRELDLRAQWLAIPAAEPGDLVSVERRVSKLGELMEDNGPWLGFAGVASEHLRLEVESRRLGRAEEVRLAGVRREQERRLVDAEEARERALLALEVGSLHEARQWFSYALERGGEGWVGAGEVARDLDRLGAEALSRSGSSSAGVGVTR